MFDVRASDGTVALATHGNGVYTARIVKKGDILNAETVENNASLAVNAYPNPAQQEVKIAGNWLVQGKNVTQNDLLLSSSITLIDPLGRVVKEQRLEVANLLPNKGFEVVIPLGNVPAGCYYLRVKVGKALKTLPLFVTSVR